MKTPGYSRSSGHAAVPPPSERWHKAADTLDQGFTFGPYRVHSCIGRGAMARVYRAEHSALRKPVALKIMERGLLQRPDGSRRFVLEARAAAQVKHPHVVDVTDVGVHEEVPYIVMELLEGEDLATHLDHRGLLSEAELAQLLLPAVAGLAAAHDAGVVHGDLKPSNIFLARGFEGDIHPKLLDFGISKLVWDTEGEGGSAPVVLKASPLYMAPEAVRGVQQLTPKSDQYSFGVVLYECVTGRPPLDGDGDLPLLEAVASGRFAPPRRHRPNLSPALERTILRAMSLDPARRFTDMRELGQALFQAAEGRTRLLWGPSFAAGAAPRARVPTLALQLARDPALALARAPDAAIVAPPQAVRPRQHSSGRRRRLSRFALSVLGLAGAGLALRWAAEPPRSPSVTELDNRRAVMAARPAMLLTRPPAAPAPSRSVLAPSAALTSPAAPEVAAPRVAAPSSADSSSAPPSAMSMAPRPAPERRAASEPRAAPERRRAAQPARAGSGTPGLPSGAGSPPPATAPSARAVVLRSAEVPPRPGASAPVAARAPRVSLGANDAPILD